MTVNERPVDHSSILYATPLNTSKVEITKFEVPFYNEGFTISQIVIEIQDPGDIVYDTAFRIVIYQVEVLIKQVGFKLILMEHETLVAV